MKVYVAQAGEDRWYDGYHAVEAVFPTLEQAQAYAEESLFYGGEWRRCDDESAWEGFGWRITELDVPWATRMV